MTIDFRPLCTDERNAELARFEFLSEIYVPSMDVFIEQAKGHLFIAEMEGGARVDWCQWFIRGLVELKDKALLEMTDLHHELYPDQKPGRLM